MDALFQLRATSTQVGSQPIISIAWLSMPRLLVTLSKDGNLQVWKTRVNLNPNRPPMQANFFEPAGIPDLWVLHAFHITIVEYADFSCHIFFVKPSFDTQGIAKCFDL